MSTWPSCSSRGAHQEAKAGSARAGPTKTSPSLRTAVGGRDFLRTQAQAPAKDRQRRFHAKRRSRLAPA
eukprot:2053174-Alexandrium_andersonii.AAC.1